MDRSRCRRGAFSTALALQIRCLRSACLIPADYMRTEADRDRLVRMLMDRYRLFRQAVSPTRLVDLPPLAADRHRVVLRHHTLGLHREDQVQVAPAASAKGRSPLLRRHRKLLIELSDISLPQKPVRFLQSPDPAQPQFLRQPILPGPEVPLRSPP